MDNNYLQHHGVKGMRWGVRKDKTQSTKTRGSTVVQKLFGKKSKTSNKTDDSTPKKKTIKDLSDAELRERVARLELEKRYKDLAKQTNPPKSSKGHAFVSSVLEQSGKNIATQLTTYVMGRGVNKIFENVFNDPAIVDPKKGQKGK